MTHEQHAPEGADDAAPAPRPARRSPFDLDALVPKPLADRGRAALDNIETARTSLDSARANVRDLGRRLRAPGGLLGPAPPPTGLPRAPVRPLQRDHGEVAALLPRAVEVSVCDVPGNIHELGWTGRLLFIGDLSPRPLIRRCPPGPLRKTEIASGLLDFAAEGLFGSHSNTADPHAVELLDPDGHVLLRSTPVARRREDRTMRDVTLADGAPVAAVIAGSRRIHHREVTPAATVRAEPVLTDLFDLYPGRDTAARVWRGPQELASIRTLNGRRTLTIAALASDDEALLVWAAVLGWWGGSNT
ncbi:hypothetical protein [Oerskovia turbata]